MIRAAKHTHKVRNDETDKADHARNGNRCPDGKSGSDNGAQFQPGRVKTQTRCRVFAKRERRAFRSRTARNEGRGQESCRQPAKTRSHGWSLPSMGATDEGAGLEARSIPKAW